MDQTQDYVEACKVTEINSGQMKHIEINGKEIVGQQMSYIKTYDQESYEVKVDGDSIKIKV